MLLSVFVILIKITGIQKVKYSLELKVKKSSKLKYKNLEIKMLIYRVSQNDSNIQYFLNIAAQIHPIILNFFKKMCREILYKTGF